MYLQVRAGNQIDLADSCKLHLPKWVGRSPNQREGDPLMLEFPSAGLSNGLPTVLVEEGGIEEAGREGLEQGMLSEPLLRQNCLLLRGKGETGTACGGREREGRIALLASEATSELNIVLSIKLCENKNTVYSYRRTLERKSSKANR